MGDLFNVRFLYGVSIQKLSKKHFQGRKEKARLMFRAVYKLVSESGEQPFERIYISQAQSVFSWSGAGSCNLTDFPCLQIKYHKGCLYKSCCGNFSDVCVKFSSFEKAQF